MLAVLICVDLGQNVQISENFVLEASEVKIIFINVMRWRGSANHFIMIFFRLVTRSMHGNHAVGRSVITQEIRHRKVYLVLFLCVVRFAMGVFLVICELGVGLYTPLAPAVAVGLLAALFQVLVRWQPESGCWTESHAMQRCMPMQLPLHALEPERDMFQGLQ